VIEQDRIEIFKIAALCRTFEEKVFELINQKVFQFPIYLSAGQEFIPATMAHFLRGKNPLIFAQHRAHSTYLSFGGNSEQLVLELLGKKTGCSGGMGGSASIQSKEINMFGHDGLMGTQIPIAVGAAFSSRKLTIAITGDAAAEEDYVMAAIAWAGTHRLPIIFVVEDNNLSILTEKKVRRNWEMAPFARSVNVRAEDIEDSPDEIARCLNNLDNLPCLLNIRTERLFWHAGAGIDDYPKTDRYQIEKTILGSIADEIHMNAKKRVGQLWQKQLEIR